MSDIKVNVQDSPYVITNTINKVHIRVMNVDLFTSVSVTVSLYNNESLIDNKFFKIEGEEYNNWGNSDQYLVDIVLTKLGLTPVA
jgi:hypothetical protein